MRQKNPPRRQALGRLGGWLIGLALLAAGAACAAPPAAPSPTPVPAPTSVPATPTSVAVVRSPTGTQIQPDGTAPTPEPDWGALFAAPESAAGGWSLLVLHTNDTWGYLTPCG